MPYGEHTAADYFPRRLYRSEIQNPHAVFHSFFDAYSLPQAIEKIDSWLKAATKNDYWKESYPARLLYFYEMLEKLAEAAYLVNTMDNRHAAAVLMKTPEQNIDFMQTAYYFRAQTKGLAWDYFPRSLSKKQFINPYLVFRKFFKYRKLPVWRDVLYDLLYNSFVAQTELEPSEYDLVIIQKHLKRLVEATYLIDIRTNVKENSPPDHTPQ